MLLLFVIRLIEICTCCYPPLIIHVQPCTETGLSVSSSGAGGGASRHREGGNDPLGACLFSRVSSAAAWGAGNNKSAVIVTVC